MVELPVVWVFRVGWRKVSVRAVSYASAVILARASLDKRVKRKGRKPPDTWDLRLVSSGGVP